MARTHKIQKAHDAFKRVDALVFNYRGSDVPNYSNAEYNDAIGELGLIGNRYGNNRKMWAKQKVNDRRQERKRLNREVEFD